jgi:serine protease Do
MPRFVRVRLIKANGLDLRRIEVDWDQTLAVIILGQDGETVLGRYGAARTSRHADRNLSLEGFAEALRGALELHAEGPKAAARLAAKKGPPPRRPTPEAFPSLSRYGKELAQKGRVAASCIHCHQVREAERSLLRDAGEPLGDAVLHPWPDPALLGLEIDPDSRATVARVVADSPAAHAGIEALDRIVEIGGAPPISIADVQWALHRAPDSGAVDLVIERGGERHRRSIALAPGWRRAEISWRGSTWDLRRMALGGMVLEPATASERALAAVAEDALALRVESAGEHGEHATARKTGFLPDDIVVAIDGLRSPMSEGQVLAHLLSRHKKGSKVPFVVIRDGKRLEFQLVQQ